MQTKTSTTIGFIGLGLIGGSIAKAIRQYYPDYQILAFDKSRETLALAMQDGTIVEITVTTPDGRRYESNLKLKQEDLDLLEMFRHLK